MPNDEKLIQADSIQYNRILCAIYYARQPVKYAVARYFCQAQVIAPEILQAVLNGQTVAPKRTPRQLSPDSIKAVADQYRKKSLTEQPDNYANNNEMIIDDDTVEKPESQLNPSCVNNSSTQNFHDCYINQNNK